MKTISIYLLASTIWVFRLAILLLPFVSIAILGWALGRYNVPNKPALIILSVYSIVFIFCWGIFVHLKMQGAFRRTIEKLKK